jgi:ribose transport system substrate-binding protein
MKKLVSLVLALCLVMGLVGTIAAEKKPMVGISLPVNPTGWPAAVEWAADATAKRLGLNYRIVTSVSEAEQADALDLFIQQGYDYVVLFPQNDTLATAAKRVIDAGIPLINFDRTLTGLDPATYYYVAGNNREMGVMGANYIAEKLNGKGKVVIVSIPAYGAIFAERVQGFRDTVAEKYPEIEILEPEYGAANGSPEVGLALMTDILTANPQIDGVYSTDDEMSIGLIQAIVESGRMGEIKVITGGGGAQKYFPLMDKYKDQMWISSQTYAPYMMITCLEITDRLIKGETVERRTIIPPSNLDYTNYQAWLDANGITPDAPY